jgi:hypothetical protein
MTSRGWTTGQPSVSGSPVVGCGSSGEVGATVGSALDTSPPRAVLRPPVTSRAGGRTVVRGVTTSVRRS